MLNQSLPPDREGDMGHGHSSEDENEELHMRQATSLLRLLRSSQDPSLQSGDLKREFLQLTALLRKIDKLAHEDEPAVDRSQGEDEEPAPPAPEYELNGTPTVFGEETTEDPDSVEPVASDWWEGRSERPVGCETVPTPDVEKDTLATKVSTSAASETGNDAEGHITPPVAGEPVETGDAPIGEEPDEAYQVTESDENLMRWWVTFSGNVSLERLAQLRARFNDSPFTIEARFVEIGDGVIVLRLVTDDRVTMQQVDWILRELMDTVGLDKDSAILSPH
jgi:hypothetical protein